MYRLKEVCDVFADACIREKSGALVFMSCYGRDTALQQLFAAFCLKVNAGGLDSVTLVDVDHGHEERVSIGDADKLTKYSGRLPKGLLFGNLSHTWIYDPVIQTPDRSNKSAWLVHDKPRSAWEPADRVQVLDRTWQLVLDLSPVPLLPHWREAIIKAMPGLIIDLAETAHPPIGRVAAFQVQLPEDFCEQVSRLVTQGQLVLDAAAQFLPPTTKNRGDRNGKYAAR